MQEIYSLRKSFSIIGITGRMGSGCTKFAEILSVSKEEFFNGEYSKFLRKPSLIKSSTNEENNFKRKYEICYKFSEKNWLKYQVIDYKKSLILYTIDFYKSEKDPIATFIETLFFLFKKSEKFDNDFPEIDIDKKFLTESLKALDFTSIIDSLKKLAKPIISVKSDEDLDILYSLFFDNSSSFSKIYESIMKHLEDSNYYLRTFLFHKLANNIRSTGSPINTQQEEGKHIYTVANMINRLIKSYKKSNNVCHIAINSLKNSLEIMFFKERYSAFYITAIHNDNRYKQRIKKRISIPEFADKTYSKLVDLDSIEYRSDTFSEGDFSAPDIQNCIQKSEIHISNNYEANDEPSFTTLNEQIIKYLSLIQQPGIITPSATERCMQIAFNAKFSSGCISRQVGAVITDQGYSVKAIGWNDVPKGSTPCLLRNVDELISKQNTENYDTYSEFELTIDHDLSYSLNPNQSNINFINKTFNQNMKEGFALNSTKVTSQGKNCSFCFKTNHNKFEGKDNQVHTRSLHAEENAMLQVAKYGGQPLANGILFTTASPCELCSKKAYQLGVKVIIYIDPYPGISTKHILGNGFERPFVKSFQGAIGKSYNKLYEPFVSYKDELKLMMK